MVNSRKFQTLFSVILLPAHPASFAHKSLFERVRGCNSMADLSLKKSILDSLVCSGDSLILDVASPRIHKPKIVNESCFLLSVLS